MERGWGEIRRRGIRIQRARARSNVVGRDPTSSEVSVTTLEGAPGDDAGASDDVGRDPTSLDPDPAMLVRRQRRWVWIQRARARANVVGRDPTLSEVPATTLEGAPGDDAGVSGDVGRDPTTLDAGPATLGEIQRRWARAGEAGCVSGDLGRRATTLGGDRR